MNPERGERSCKLLPSISRKEIFWKHTYTCQERKACSQAPQNTRPCRDSLGLRSDSQTRLTFPSRKSVVCAHTASNIRGRRFRLCIGLRGPRRHARAQAVGHLSRSFNHCRTRAITAGHAQQRIQATHATDNGPTEDSNTN